MNLCYIQSDITDLGVDAVVLPANQNLKKGSGASEAIFHAAGETALVDACYKIGHCDLGSAVVTPAFRLNATYIIHACVPKWEGGNQGEYDFLCAAYLSALTLADQLQAKSIAFPLLSSGNNQFNKKLALEIAINTISKFEAEHLQQAVLVVYDEASLENAQAVGCPVIRIVHHSMAIRPAQKKKVSDNMMKVMDDAVHWVQNPEVRKKLLGAALAFCTPLLEKYEIPVDKLEDLINK